MKSTEILNKIKTFLGEDKVEQVEETQVEETQLEESQEKVELAQAKLENGTVLEAEAFESGNEIFIVTEDEIKTAVMQEARKYPGEENKVIEFYQKNPEAANAVKAPLFEEKVVDHIISKCSIKDIKVTSEKLYEDNVIADPTAKSKNKTKSKTTKTSKSVKAKPKK